ncbi:MAG: HNH endonuclease [Rufibacter sp.]
MNKISLKDIFPIIKNTIREINLDKEWADRDSIVHELVKNRGIQSYLLHLDTDTFENRRRLGNLVDWFSAHFTTEAEFMQEYLLEFERKQMESKSSKGVKRKVWAYKVLTTKVTEEVDATEVDAFSEGSVTKILVNNYERNVKARKACISHHGLNCTACGFNFKAFYGAIGESFIHVHHLKEISKIGEEYTVDPITDLIPVCANCHAMLHKSEPPLTIDELKQKINNN